MQNVSRVYLEFPLLIKRKDNACEFLLPLPSRCRSLSQRCCGLGEGRMDGARLNYSWRQHYLTLNPLLSLPPSKLRSSSNLTTSGRLAGRCLLRQSRIRASRTPSFFAIMANGRSKRLLFSLESRGIRDSLSSLPLRTTYVPLLVLVAGNDTLCVSMCDDASQSRSP